MVKKQVTAEKPPASPTTTREAPSPPKPKRATRASSSAPLWLVATSLLALAVAFGVGHQLDRPSAGALQLQRLARRVATTIQAVAVQVETAVGSTPSKYKTDIVHTTARALLDASQCPDAAYTPGLLLDGRKVHVTDAMDGPTLAGTDKVFFMLNGANEGLYVSWNQDFGCLAQAAAKAAQWLGADRDEIANGVRLYSQMGLPIRTTQELEAARHLVHVLLDFQLWQWPGIRKGHTYVLENGVTLTTVGLSPKVLDVQFFLTQAEADKIRALGEPSLNRSKVDGANASVVSQSRTSHTAFLPDEAFTREFRRRSAVVTRLPSASYVERLQLVRYAAGEFYRQHLDTFHSRDFLPKGANLFSMDDYKTWAQWARGALAELENDARVPDDFKAGGKLFPDGEDDRAFPNAALELFYERALAANYFKAESDEAWQSWLRDNLDKNAKNIMPGIMKDDGKPHYLPLIVRAWEEKLALPELRYTFPKDKPVNGVTHLFRWVRWAKERVTFLGDHVPAIARHEGELFPKYTVAFQSKLLDFVLDDYSEALITKLTNAEWYNWLVENRGRNHVLFQAVQAFPQLTELAIRSWEARVNAVGDAQLHYTMPKWVRHFHPQRYVTLFLYLNNETKIGGETVFPHSLDRYNDEHIEREGMSECSSGLAVPPLGLHASLFYVQTPEGEVDHMSRHGGCPPHEGVKWGSNSFMWNADADEGADLWTTK